MKSLLHIGRAQHGGEGKEHDARRGRFLSIRKQPPGQADHYGESDKKLNGLSHSFSIPQPRAM